MRTYYCGMSGAEIVDLPDEAVRDCSAVGDCEGSVLYWVGRVAWKADDATLRAMLKECGAWDDLAEASSDTLRERALWVAACDFHEEDARAIETA